MKAKLELECCSLVHYFFRVKAIQRIHPIDYFLQIEIVCVGLEIEVEEGVGGRGGVGG